MDDSKKLIKIGLLIGLPFVISMIFYILFPESSIAAGIWLLLCPFFIVGFYKLGKYIQELNDYNNKGNPPFSQFK